MPVIYSTDDLQAMSQKLVQKHPDQDVIILKNSVMCYAFDASARAIWRMNYPGQKARNRINLAAADIQKTIDRLVAAGLSVGICDLDTPPDDNT